MERIDFSASYLSWLTKREKSYGRFLIEAACTIGDPASDECETYYLAPAVIAGNVYAPKDLVKYPLYWFQIAASPQGHIIFRNFVCSKEGGSSCGINTELFDQMNFNISKSVAREIHNFDELDMNFDRCDSLSARLNYALPRLGPIEIEFPVKHINIRRQAKAFQVETGPILIPLPPEGNQSIPGKTSLFTTAFIHFNEFSRAELTLVEEARKCEGQEASLKFGEKMNVRIVMLASSQGNHKKLRKDQ